MRVYNDYIKGTKSLNLAENYPQHWTCSNAYREIISNLYDEVLERCSVGQPPLVHFYESDGENEWFFIQGPITNEKICLYAKMEIDSAKSKMILVNFGVALPRRWLGIGYSRKSPRAIGQFGEGMKAGINKLVCDDAKVVYYTNSQEWIFSTQNGLLCIKAKKLKPKEAKSEVTDNNYSNGNRNLNMKSNKYGKLNKS